MNILKVEKHGCTPCKMVGQLLDSKGIEYDTGNIEDDPSLIDKHGIMSVPVIILFDDDNVEIQRSVGFNPGELEQIIKQL